jgi:acetate kinase
MSELLPGQPAAASIAGSMPSQGALLVVNAGSSSLKFGLYPSGDGDDAPLCSGAVTDIGHRPRLFAHDGAGMALVDTLLPEGADHEATLARLLPWLAERFATWPLVAAGHRVVHGGPHYAAPLRITPDVLDELRRLVPLAPLHQPHHIAAIEALGRLHPALTQVACFDTAFHHDQPAVASAFALPRDLSAQGIRRYGFHGLSYEYIASLLPTVLGERSARGRVIVAHLGAGASLCALRDGRSVATTMGFTALDGLPMAQRCGSLDPGVVLYLIDALGMSAHDVSDLLYHRCGLLGVSGISDDMRTLLASDDPRAAEAVALFAYRIVREIGSLAAALGGLDALVFTAGIGEHAAAVRARVCDALGWLGVQLDTSANARAAGQTPARISSDAATVAVWVLRTDEDLMIARHVRQLLR